ncbi:MAG: RNA polymerase sigma factor [Actinobacteria bacterium]|nr:RNA polymerase sigma factor [Actinomycetota bacterium]
MEPNFQLAEPRSVAAEVRRLRGGDPDAADALARRAMRLALRTAAALLESREEASDIAQDVAVDALRSLGKLRDPDAFDAWVHRITVRHAMRRLKRRRRARQAETPLALLAETAQPVVPQDIDPDALTAARQALATALAGLPARRRLALALRYVHDLPDAEIAAALGCREGTVHALLSRDRQALRRDRNLVEIAIDFKGG